MFEYCLFTANFYLIHSEEKKDEQEEQEIKNKGPPPVTFLQLVCELI